MRLVSIEDTDEGKVLIVDGADLLDGTPIYDIKPYNRRSDCHEDAVSGFVETASRPALTVKDPDDILEAIPDDKRSVLISRLEMDPRPSYHDDDRTYTMHFSEYDISFTVADDVLKITGIKKL